MAQNINWKEIAKMLDVEIGVPFKIVIPKYLKEYIQQRSMKECNIDEIEYCIYEDGFACHDDYRYMFSGYDNVLYDLVTGGILNNAITIKRKRCKPEDGDDYYYVYMNKKGYYIMDKDYMSDNYFDIMNYVNGNCFKTREEALKAAENMYKEFKDKIDSLDKDLYI